MDDKKALALRAEQGLSIIDINALHATRKHKSYVLENKPAKAVPPPEGIACITCTNAMWYSTGKSADGFCRIMFKDISTSARPGSILICDGNRPEEDEQPPSETPPFVANDPFITDNLN